MKILFTGDVNFRNKENITREDSQKALESVKPYLEAADFRIVNLECPLSDDDSAPIKKSGPNLISPRSCICFLEEAGVDGTTLANNHIGDFGRQPIIDTLALLSERNIKSCGAGADIDEAYKAMYFEKDGLSVAILSVCENEFGIAKKNEYGAAGYNVNKIYRAIRTEKQNADYVIVVFHGGCEQNPLPSPRCVERYKLLCDFGADAVVAGHTHCPQPAVCYNGKPIIYSMGNFFFSSSAHSEANDPWFYGYMVMLDVTRNGIVYDLIPYRAEDGVTKIRVFEGEAREKMLSYLDKLSKITADDDELLKHYKGWCYHVTWYWADRPTAKKDSETLAPSKNVVSCESHHELLYTNYCILIDGEEKTGEEYWEKVKHLMQMPI